MSWRGDAPLAGAIRPHRGAFCRTKSSVPEIKRSDIPDQRKLLYNVIAPANPDVIARAALSRSRCGFGSLRLKHIPGSKVLQVLRVHPDVVVVVGRRRSHVVEPESCGE